MVPIPLTSGMHAGKLNEEAMELNAIRVVQISDVISVIDEAAIREDVSGGEELGILSRLINGVGRFFGARGAAAKGNNVQAVGYAASASCSGISVALRAAARALIYSGMGLTAAATMASIGWIFGIAGSAVGLGSDIADRTDPDGADLKQADLSNAHLRGAFLEGAHLEGADLSEADLMAALEGAHLEKANLSDAAGLSGGTAR
jgi:Pentapeptide repeats (8 copies)